MRSIHLNPIRAGIGRRITEENLPKIFSPDFTTKPIDKGTGLGLASVKTMVEAYSGSIRAESKEGEGTTFTFRIPIKRPMDHN